MGELIVSPSYNNRERVVMMKKHMSTIIAILVFITGLSLLLYPTVSNYWNSLHQSRVVANYSDTLAKMDKKEKQAAIDAAVEYNAGLVNNGNRFTPSDSELSLYKSLLNADGTGMMGYVTIPKIQVKLAIYHTVDESVLQVGVGHLEGSSLPVGGSSTHCVISSHRGLPSAKLFTDLDQLKKGDVFYLHVYDKVLAYQVDNIAVVEPNDYGLLEIEEGKDLCTLFTCTPYGINTHRLLVRGHRIENVMDEKNLTADAAKVDPLVVASVIGLIMLGIGYIVYRFRKKGV
jgi:sortase A